MSLNAVSMIFNFAFGLMYIQIASSHPFFSHWQPLLGNTTATCSLPQPENERQWSVNNVLSRILANLCSDWLQTSIYRILAAFTGKNNSEMLPAAS